MVHFGCLFAPCMRSDAVVSDVIVILIFLRSRLSFAPYLSCLVYPSFLSCGFLCKDLMIPFHPIFFFIPQPYLFLS